MNIFLSNFSLDSEQYDHLIHHLSKTIRPNSRVAVIKPKSLLRRVMGDLDSVHFIVVGDYVSGFESSASVPECDYVLGEPSAFNAAGFLVNPSESSLWNGSIIACAPLSRFSEGFPSDYDLVEGKALLCEKGVYRLDHLPFIRP